MKTAEQWAIEDPAGNCDEASYRFIRRIQADALRHAAQIVADTPFQESAKDRLHDAADRLEAK